jgi:hypothetical protein
MSITAILIWDLREQRCWHLSIAQHEWQVQDAFGTGRTGESRFQLAFPSDFNDFHRTSKVFSDGLTVVKDMWIRYAGGEVGGAWMRCEV